MKRIAHIITDLDIGGAEKQILLLLPYLKKEFDNHVICCMGKGVIGQDLERLGINVHYLGVTNNFDMSVIWKMYRSIKNIRPDVIITYLIFADIAGRIIGRIAGVKKIVCSQRSSLPGRDYVRFLDKMTSNLVTAYTVQTFISRQLLSKRLGVPVNKFTVIPNAVHVPENRKREIQKGKWKIEKRKQLGFTENDIIITYVGNMKNGKGHNVLLEAAKLITNYQLPITNFLHFILVGDGVLRQKMENETEECDISKIVHFLGLRNDVQDILVASDIFVTPSCGEGMSNALLEAMATGLPCIVSDINVHREMIKDRENGLLFKTGNAEDLAENIQFLLEHKNIRIDIGLRAREYVKRNHDPIIVSPLWTDVINKVLSL